MRIIKSTDPLGEFDNVDMLLSGVVGGVLSMTGVASSAGGPEGSEAVQGPASGDAFEGQALESEVFSTFSPADVVFTNCTDAAFADVLKEKSKDKSKLEIKQKG